jgi:hypothetical protein
LRRLVAGIGLVAVIGCGSSSDGGAPADGGGVGDAPVQMMGDGGAKPGDAPLASDSSGGGDAPATTPGTDGSAIDGGGSAMLDDSGKAALGAMDGITGTINGKVVTYTTSAQVTDSGTAFMTLLLEARPGPEVMGNRDGWTLTIPKKTGVFPCGKNGDPNDGTFALVGGPAGYGTAYGVPGSGCTLEVKSVVGKVEGRFVAVLSGLAGAKNIVTSGYFHFAAGLADCSTAKDPGVPAGTNGATLAVTAVKGKSSVYACGQNIRYQAQSSNQFEPVITFTGKSGTRDVTLTIEGVTATGSFMCGQTASAASARKILLSLGEFMFIPQSSMNGGSCTITVTQYDDTAIAGTYLGTLWNSYTIEHSELTAQGSFRIPRKFP